MGRSLRIRKKTPPEAALMADPEIGLEGLRDGIVWKDVFGRECPVEIEIGFGKGRHLLHLAAERPEVGFLGIEVANAYLRLAHYRALRRLLANVRLLRANAAEVLAELVPPASVQAVHILFPDPWPKKRHHKRRLVQPAFVATVRRLLTTGGRLNVATDHPGYAEAIEATLAAAEGLERLDQFHLEAEQLAALTNYGSKYAREGRSFFSWSLLKTSA